LPDATYITLESIARFVPGLAFPGCFG
jgi:hypothetical protein